MMPKFPELFGVRTSSIHDIRDRRTYDVAKKLPHGSGINAEWTVEEKNDRILACNSYETMDEHGFYDRWQDFCLSIPKTRPSEFKLHFTGDRSALRRYPWLRDYLEETIALSLEE